MTELSEIEAWVRAEVTKALSIAERDARIAWLVLKGWSWARVGEALGYRSHRSAFTAAKQWAERTGLPWPPDQRQTVGT